MDTGEVKEAVGDAVMELLDVEPPYGELEKGVPLISFACKQGEGDAVLVKALPLPEADAWLGREKAASGEALYRVDYLARGNRVYATGVLPAGCGRGSFLERLGEAVERGDRKAGQEPLCRLLGMHLALCGLEGLACQERALLGKGLPLGEEAGDSGEEDGEAAGPAGETGDGPARGAGKEAAGRPGASGRKNAPGADEKRPGPGGDTDG